MVSSLTRVTSVKFVTNITSIAMKRVKRIRGRLCQREERVYWRSLMGVLGGVDPTWDEPTLLHCAQCTVCTVNTAQCTVHTHLTEVRFVHCKRILLNLGRTGTIAQLHCSAQCTIASLQKDFTAVLSPAQQYTVVQYMKYTYYSCVLLCTVVFSAARSSFSSATSWDGVVQTW